MQAPGTRNGLVVDLHRMIVGIGVPAETAWAFLTSRTETWTVGRFRVEVPDLLVRAFLLALHMAHHGPSFARTREDLVRAIESVPVGDWHEVRDIATTLGADEALANGLSAVEGGPELSARMGLQPGRAVSPPGSAMFHTVQGLLWLAREPGVRKKGRYLWRKLFPPPATVRGRAQWSQSSDVALVFAYVIRLAQLAWRTPRALSVLFALLRERRK